MSNRRGESQVTTEHELLRQYVVSRKKKLCKEFGNALDSIESNWFFVDLEYYDGADGKCDKCGRRLRWRYILYERAERKTYGFGSECVHRATGIDREDVEALKKVFLDIDKEVKEAEKVLALYNSYDEYLDQRNILRKLKASKGRDKGRGGENRGFFEFVEKLIDNKAPLPAQVESLLDYLYRESVGREKREDFIRGLDDPNLAKMVEEIAKDNHPFKVNSYPAEERLFSMMDKINQFGTLTDKQREVFVWLANSHLKSHFPRLRGMLIKYKDVPINPLMKERLVKLTEKAKQWGLNKEEMEEAAEIAEEIEAAAS